ncbi:MAG: DUF4147 domain-containing protein [Nitrosopumilaceae archaeon]|nr:DUF4147 domain-containing protein [Nitrosopumilaceae archaeon]
MRTVCINGRDVVHYYILQSGGDNHNGSAGDATTAITISGREEIIAESDRRRDCISIVEAGLAAADPAMFIPRYVREDRICTPDPGVTVRLDDYNGVYTVAFGKAADSMTRAANGILQDRLSGGVITIPRGSRSAIRGRKFRIFNAGHPVPDKASVRAAKESIKFLRARRSGDLVIFLISGGGSSLLALPDGITLGQKVHMTNLLLKCGAPIREINTVRSALSGVKGGRLAGHLRCDAVSLIMSDVEGDDVASIASGPTYLGEAADGKDGRYGAALDVIARYGLSKKADKAVVDCLFKKAQAQRDGPSESAGSGAGRMMGNYVIARNADCLEAMVAAAKRLGYGPSDSTPLQVFGDIKEAADAVYGEIPPDGRRCVIFGGESTIKVLGRGVGGRNQEMVLRLLKKSQRMRGAAAQGRKRRRDRLVIASAGTDGIDGNSINAGAIAENEIVDIRLVNDAIRNSDSGGFFERRKRSESGGAMPPSLIRTGPTHTNLMDVGVVLT